MAKNKQSYLLKAIILILVFIIFTSTGCEYFWPYDNENEIVIPSKIISSIYSYNTQPVTKGTVKKIRSVSSAFTSTDKTTYPATKLDGLYFIFFFKNK